MPVDCRTISFTCDRVGLGQSTLVASIGLILSANGRRVLVIDWDLEKPSLARFLIPFFPPKTIEKCDGLIDIVWNYVSTIRHDGLQSAQQVQLLYANPTPIECTIPRELCLRDGGALHFLSAGREPGRSLRVKYFNWGEFLDRFDGQVLLDTLLKESKKKYDHIIFDCPRISNSSKFPILNADVLVSCFSWDSESMEAGARVARWATERRVHRPLLVYPLALRSIRHTEFGLVAQMARTRDRLFKPTFAR